MTDFGVIIGLICVMFASIIGVYCWTYKVATDTNKQLAAIYSLVNVHFQDSKIHRDVSEFVSVLECKALHTALKENVLEIRKDTNEIKRDIKMYLCRGNNPDKG